MRFQRVAGGYYQQDTRWHTAGGAGKPVVTRSRHGARRRSNTSLPRRTQRGLMTACTFDDPSLGG